MSSDNLGSFRNIPENILIGIFQFLRVKDLVKCQRTCTYWDYLIRENTAVLPKIYCHRLIFEKAILAKKRGRLASWFWRVFRKVLPNGQGKLVNRVVIESEDVTHVVDTSILAQQLRHYSAKCVLVGENWMPNICKLLEQLHHYQLSLRTHALTFKGTDFKDTYRYFLISFLKSQKRSLVNLKFFAPRNARDILTDEVILSAGDLRKLIVLDSVRPPNQMSYPKITDKTLHSIANQRCHPFELVNLSSCSVTAAGVVALIKGWVKVPFDFRTNASVILVDCRVKKREILELCSEKVEEKQPDRHLELVVEGKSLKIYLLKE